MNKKKLYIIGIAVLVILLVVGIFMCHLEEKDPTSGQNSEQMGEDEGLKVEENDDGYGESIDFEDLISGDEEDSDSESNNGNSSDSESNTGDSDNQDSQDNSDDKDNQDNKDDKDDDDDKNSGTSESGWSPFF